ncbi:MAG TPA: homoserine dehydrogenase, partial [Saprospiraceae bacterium]|nr:homoserine dehydrogenase [Saprospiraceae bacterium]
MERKHLKIGLFGFGCVGYGLHEVLEKTPGLQARIARICIKDPSKSRPVSQERFTIDRDEILKDDSLNVVVELIDDADAAFDLVREALKRGQAGVTANKKMIAEHLPELLDLQRLYGSPLLYEAACCASIPIIRNLEEYYDNDMLQSIEGIVNGSTNYILTKTGRDRISYADALAQAQQSGYAESDPALDTQGYDAKYKLLILLAHAFGMVVSPGEVFHSGIDQLGELELKYAREKNFKIKLVAHARKLDDGLVSAYVLPRFIRPDEKL